MTGGGFLQAASIVPKAPADGNDNFGGNAKPMKSGTIQGHWNHVDHGTGNHLGGTVQYLSCRHVDEPGPGKGGGGGKKALLANQAYFGGPARFQTGGTWNEGYWFDVVVKDHGEPGTTDTYHLTVRLAADAGKQQSGTVVYEIAGTLAGGNIQMHAPNGGHPEGPSVLPSWVSLEP